MVNFVGSCIFCSWTIFQFGLFNFVVFKMIISKTRYLKTSIHRIIIVIIYNNKLAITRATSQNETMRIIRVPTIAPRLIPSNYDFETKSREK